MNKREQLECALGFLLANIEDAVRQHDAVFNKEHDLRILKEANAQFDKAEREAVDKTLNAIIAITGMEA